MSSQKMNFVKAVRKIEKYQPIKDTRAKRCTACGSTDVQFRSRTRVIKCMDCGNEMPALSRVVF